MVDVLLEEVVALRDELADDARRIGRSIGQGWGLAFAALDVGREPARMQ
jgi:hypothetical protein